MTAGIVILNLQNTPRNRLQKYSISLAKGLCIPQIFVRYELHLLEFTNDMRCITLLATVSQLRRVGHLCHKPRLSTCRWGRCINFSKPVFVTLVQPYRSMFVILVKFSAIEAKLMSVICVHWPIFKTRRS